MVRIEALNQALKGLPPDRIRLHLCWGSWHGPHPTFRFETSSTWPSWSDARLLIRSRQRPP